MTTRVWSASNTAHMCVVAPHMHHQAPATRLLLLTPSVLTLLYRLAVYCERSTAILIAIAVVKLRHVLVSAAAMELVAMELKQSGSFIARTLSYEVCFVETQPACSSGTCSSHAVGVGAALRMTCSADCCTFACGVAWCSFSLAASCLTKQLWGVTAWVLQPSRFTI